VLSAEGFDGRRRIHVGQRDEPVRKAHALERLPAGFHLRDFSHVGHGAACIEVRQDDLLAGVAEHVRAFGHEVHAAENKVLGVGLRGDSGELVAVAREVGEADDFVALIVVSEQNGGRAETLARRRDTLVHSVIGEREVVFKAADAASLRRGRR